MSRTVTGDGVAAVSVLTAKVTATNGEDVALIEAITIGGGTQTITVDGVPEDRQHPTFHRWNVRLLSPDRMIPDQLREVETYDEAVDVAVRYATLRVEHADRVAALATDLKV